MANYLNFDVYDLELTVVNGNSDLRKLLIATRNHSILVVEDIDCSLHLQGRLAKRIARGWGGWVEDGRKRRGREREKR
ncbi:hypothetical protein VIGAN_05102100 [Vigna angularis var. angularis]|uniref:ATPase AAA-type core domain-containing protein n=1 Tax=Vigna angularis var. angularis TaxID=157739 RepID=A0A0S3S472_PHAAN|nr:hypothetical protein VIGAN_05102100 [Vigna angularis var. angularis]